ncbi:PAS-domain containing protein, partial [Actibacterium sp.]|uniref:PAS domain-containing protein n=1 Tax=Actibacterium sp. TaxID=1872125 RepID=UPI0035641D66
MKTTAFSRDESADLMLEGLDHIDQGVTIFDADLKLVAWNNRFLEMLNFPEILAFEGADFASFIRHNALRGEYGAGDVEQQVAERVNNALKFEKHKFERTNADGRILQVAGTPLRRGGFMTVYTDVSLQHSIQDELERRVAERTEALKLSDERLKLIANEVPA